MGEAYSWDVEKIGKLQEKIKYKLGSIEKAIEYINKTKYSDVVGLNSNSIKDFWFVRELKKILDNKGSDK